MNTKTVISKIKKIPVKPVPISVHLSTGKDSGETQGKNTGY